MATHQIWVNWWTKALGETDVQIAADMVWVREQWKKNHQTLLDDWNELWKFNLKQHYTLYNPRNVMLGFDKLGCLNTENEMVELIDAIVGMSRGVGEITLFSKKIVRSIVGRCWARVSTEAGF